MLCRPKVRFRRRSQLWPGKPVGQVLCFAFGWQGSSGFLCCLLSRCQFACRKVRLTGGSAGSSVLDEEERIYRELQVDSDRLQLRSSKYVPWQSFAWGIYDWLEASFQQMADNDRGFFLIIICCFTPTFCPMLPGRVHGWLDHAEASREAGANVTNAVPIWPAGWGVTGSWQCLPQAEHRVKIQQALQVQAESLHKIYIHIIISSY